MSDQPKARPTVVYLPIPNQEAPNPFRRGSVKAKCFEVFRAGGDRQELIAKMREMGVTRSTCATWVHIFRVYTRGLREGKKGGAE